VDDQKTSCANNSRWRFRPGPCGVGGVGSVSLLSGVQASNGNVATAVCQARADPRTQQLIRETSRSLIEVALEVGYTSPSHFAKVFWWGVTGAPPKDFRIISQEAGGIKFFSRKNALG